VTGFRVCSSDLRGKNDINIVRFLTQTARFVSYAIIVYLRVIKSCLIYNI